MVKGLAYSSVRRGRGVRYRFNLEASPPSYHIQATFRKNSECFDKRPQPQTRDSKPPSPRPLTQDVKRLYRCSSSLATVVYGSRVFGGQKRLGLVR